MKTNRDYTLRFKVANSDYGMITIPKGTRVTHQTALGIDKNYHFVNEYDWIDKNYPNIANLLKMDIHSYGINIPKEYVEEAIEILNDKKAEPHPKVIELTLKLEKVKKTLDVISEIISYDDRDEDKKIREIVELLNEE